MDANTNESVPKEDLSFTLKSDTREEVPLVSDELVEYLNKVYPLRGYSSVKTLEELHTYRGAREVVELLESLRQAQIEG